MATEEGRPPSGEAPESAAAATTAAGGEPATMALRVGEEQVDLDLALLEKIEPGSMLLPLLGSRWADTRSDGLETPRQLELDVTAGVEAEAVLVLLREYAKTGVLRRADVHRFCAPAPAAVPAVGQRKIGFAVPPEDIREHDTALQQDKVRELLNAALYLGFSRLAPMVPDAPNALAWSELATIVQRRTWQSLAGINLVCQVSSDGVHNVHGIDLSGAGLTGMQLNLRDWSEAKLQGVSFSLAVIRGASASEKKEAARRTKQDPSGHLGIDFIKADLSQASFVGACLDSCSLAEASLQKANFAGAEIVGCSFTKANLQGGNFACAVMKECDFTDADLRECNFSGANFETCKFSKANLEACNFSGAEFSNYKFGGVTLRDTSFAGCSFKTDSIVSSDIGARTNFSVRPTVAQETDCGLFFDLAPSSDLASCDFRDATFLGDLTGGYQQYSMETSGEPNPNPPGQTCLPSCGLRLAVTEEHRLTQMQSVSSTTGGFGQPAAGYRGFGAGGAAPAVGGFGANPPGGFRVSPNLPFGQSAAAAGGYGFAAAPAGPTMPTVEPEPGPGDEIVYLQYTTKPTEHGDVPRVEGQAVRRLNLAGAKLSGASFDGCTLCNVDLSDTSLRGCSFRGARLSMASLKGADASGVDFTGADLSFANLDGADLAGAQLREVSFWCLLGYPDLEVDPHTGRHKGHNNPFGQTSAQHTFQPPSPTRWAAGGWRQGCHKRLTPC